MIKLPFDRKINLKKLFFYLEMNNVLIKTQYFLI